MKKNVTLFLLSFIAYSSFSQDAMKEGFLNYTVSTHGLNNQGKEIKRITKYSLQFSGNLARRTESLRPEVFAITLVNCFEKTTGFFVNNGEKYYSSEDSYSPRLFNLGAYDDIKPSVLVFNDTATINGFSCKKALLLYNNNDGADTMEVWYTPGYMIETACFDHPFKEIKGLPVYFKFIQKLKMTIGVSAYPKTIEYSLDYWGTSNPYKVDSIDNRMRYVELGEEEKMQKLMEVFSGPAKTNVKPRGRAVTQQIVSADGKTVATFTKYDPFSEGEKLDNFKVSDITGVEKSLDGYGKNIVVINFWFTQCGPCIKEMPLLNKVMAANKENPVSFASITYNSKQEVADFLKTHTFNFDKIVGATDLIEKLGVSTYPATIIIDAAHVIRYTNIGAFTSEEQLQKEIDKLLPK